MKVLCVCPIGIGNYLMFYPACRHLKRLRPDWSLHLLGLREGIRDFAAGDTLWDGIHVFDPTSMAGRVDRQVAAVLVLRRSRFEMAINFFPSNKWMYNLLPLLAGIPQRVGFDYHHAPVAKLGFLLTWKVAVDPLAHDVRQNVGAVESITGESLGEVGNEFPTLFGPEEVAWAREYLQNHRIEQAIAIHTGSSGDHGMDAKRWEAERFGALADRIAAKMGASVLIMGGADEAELKARAAHAMKVEKVIVQPVPLRRTAALLGCAKLALCNDSGLMHMASCLGTPTVGVFGPTDERRNGPMGERSLCLRKKMEGFPLWTAANVGSRAVPRGLDPRASLLALTVDDAWGLVEPWMDRGMPAGVS